MDMLAKFEGFAGYLKQSDPEIFEVFKDQGSLSLYPDSDQQGVYNLAIILSSDYYTEEQGNRLFALWKAYLVLPMGS